MAGFRAPDSSFLLLGLILLVVFVRPSHAFGAGNIASVSKVEGVNWRHGDIEDTLLTLLASRASNKKFSKLDVKRVYFGNWLRDYSQAVDVGALKMVSAEAIRLLLWILGFISFGYGTKEFEVTSERLGCYRPEEHIDNPKDYADNEDARRYDRRLRAPVDERRELAIDERTGLKMYIASEDQGITTSAGMVRDLLRRCIDLGRRGRRNRDDAAMYEAFRLLGTSNHCLEDYSAHSNYVELCLIEMGERDVFPHVGRDTRVRVRGARDAIWPLVTGTFGGVDFLHSVLGEVGDKATQSEIEELEGTISDAERNRKASSVIRDLLDKLPDGILGGGEKDKAEELQQNANTAQMQNMQISPKDPEEFTRQAEDIRRQIYPAIEFHDNLMREITETIDKIPILPELLEQLQEQLNIFIFGLIAPFILPVIKQIKEELSTGSSEIINSSRQAQHIVFNDDRSSDPTHSMISKDHFSNVLNEPAGKVASQVVKWAVPQIVECWDDERADAERTINRIINGVFHHPALRDGGEDGARDAREQMFRVVESWWQSQSERSRDDLRRKLSREGVENGQNHKEGVHDKGHGCGKPLGMPNVGTSASSGAIGGVLGAAVTNALNDASGGGRPSSGYGGGRQSSHQQIVSDKVEEAVGGGLLGSIVGGVAGGLLGGLTEGSEKKSSSHSESYGGGGSYGGSSYQSSNRPSSRHDNSGGYGSSQYRQEEQTSSYGGGSYTRTEERRSEYSSGGGSYGQQSSYGQQTSYGQHSSGGYGGRSEQTDTMPGSFGGEREHYSSESNRRDDDDDDNRRRNRSREREERSYGGRSEHESSSYGRQDYGSSGSYAQQSGGYTGGRQEYGSSGYGQESGGGYGGGRSEYSSRREDDNERGGGYSGYGGGHGRRDEDDEGGYSRRRDNDDEDQSYGRRRDRNESYGQSGGYGSSGYGGGNSGYGDRY